MTVGARHPRGNLIRGAALALVAGIYCALPVKADPYPVDDRIDVEHYRFEISLSDDSDHIVVAATIEARILDPKTRKLTLDLVNASAPEADSGMTVSSVATDGEALAYSHRNDRLTIDLPRAAAKNGRITLRTEYSGQASTGFIIGDNKHGERSFFSDNWPNKARHWLATIDHIADKATVEFIVTAPSRLRIVSNGLEVERSKVGDNTTRTHWRQSVPISPWLYVLAAAEFAVQQVDTFDNKSIETWVYWQDRVAGFYDFAVPSKDALEFYSRYVGPFEYEKLANIQSNSVGGGMEAASAILYGDDSVTGERTRRWQSVIVHEIAHQWFGNSVTEESWDEVWLSEGFATYFTNLYFEHANGQSDFIRYMLDARDKVRTFSEENPDYTLVHNNLQDMSKVTTGQIYQKGAWVLHMLREQIGDDNWWQGIQRYYGRYRNATATTADFQREMERACACDLNNFFDYWLRTGSTVVLDGGWFYDEGSKMLHIDLKRSGHTEHSPALTIEAAVFYPDSPLPQLLSIPLDDEGGALEMDARMKPLNVLLDPNTRLLAAWSFSERSVTVTGS